MYPDVADAMLAVIRLHDDYERRNTSRGDFSILARNPKRAVIIEFMGTTDAIIESQMNRRFRLPWAMDISYWARANKTSAGAVASMETDVMNLIEHLLAYPTLDSQTGVVSSMPAGAMSSEERYISNTNWWRISIPWGVEERKTIAIAT